MPKPKKTRPSFKTGSKTGSKTWTGNGDTWRVNTYFRPRKAKSNAQVKVERTKNGDTVVTYKNTVRNKVK